MRHPMKLALGCAVILVVTGLLAAVATPASSPAPSPYVSSLAGLAGGEASAAPSACQNSGCNRYGHCSKVRGYNCRYAAGECSQSAC